MLALGAVAAAGCSAQTTSSDAAARPSAQLEDNGSNGAAPQRSAEDAAASKAAPYQGNPLCLTESEKTCMPDDDGYQRSAKYVECATAPPDAGDSGPATGIVSEGCRITRDPKTDVIAPRCAKAAPSGRDGATCEIGEDCAPGLDCIVGEKGTKSCRHYCCSGTCIGNMSNGSATFCDVQSLVFVRSSTPPYLPQKAPVCMPLKRCRTLLGTGECAANESCTVVTEGGDTGCVVIGDKQVGESCDESHCGANLACLGQPGARKCFKLCRVNASDCPSSQACTTSAAFKGADFGICQ